MKRALLLGLILVHVLSFGSHAASARMSMSFRPGERGHLAAARSVHGYHRTAMRARRGGGRHVAAHGRHGRSVAIDEGNAAEARPGPGFTLENGVLTYPAPARFQPKNLKRPK